MISWYLFKKKKVFTKRHFNQVRTCHFHLLTNFTWERQVELEEQMLCLRSALHVCATIWCYSFLDSVCTSRLLNFNQIFLLISSNHFYMAVWEGVNACGFGVSFYKIWSELPVILFTMPFLVFNIKVCISEFLSSFDLFLGVGVCIFGIYVCILSLQFHLFIFWSLRFTIFFFFICWGFAAIWVSNTHTTHMLNEILSSWMCCVLSCVSLQGPISYSCRSFCAAYATFSF